jgi:chaperonin GroES
MPIDINKALASHNIADDLKEDELLKISNFVFEGYKIDLDSRKDWERNVDKWTKLALQSTEQKNFPWANAANVKYPLLSTAAMQFAARAYPALVPGDGNVVQARIIGKELQGQKTAKAEHIAKHMSWQLTYQMTDWEDDMDKLLVILPVVGTVFKKTYFDATKGRNVSKMVLPKDLVVNYWAKSLEEAERKTEVIEMSKRVLRERQLSGIYCDIELPEPPMPEGAPPRAMGQSAPATADYTTPYRILEQHTFYDLDEDGYPEPYIITIEESTKKVLRIVARFEKEDIQQGEKGGIARIEPMEYYTKFPFIPNPDGGFYDIGFGLLLGSINETINTSINQLLDAGTLKSLPSGFISKSMRLRTGEQRIGPGEWRNVNATGEQMKGGIVPLPVTDPSATTLELMGALIESGNKLASVAEIFVGKMPGQNTPATTTMASVEQAMKLFTAVYKRIFKALEKEYKKLFKLNSMYLDEKEYQNVLDEPVTKADYDMTLYDVCPGADPTAFSSTQKLVKAQALVELLQIGTVNPIEVTKRILDAQEQPNWEQLIVQQPPPDPKQQEMQMKMQIEQQKAQMKAQEMQMKMQMEQVMMEMEKRQKEMEMVMDAQMKQMELQFKQAEAQLKLKTTVMQAHADIQATKAKSEADQQSAQQDMKLSKEQHGLDMKMATEKHKMQKEQMAEKAKEKKSTDTKK